MIISAYGFVLLFISEQAILLSYLAYPPFGFGAVSYMGLASYLIFKGIYSGRFLYPKTQICVDQFEILL